VLQVNVVGTPAPGEHILRVRAIDDRGDNQPDARAWNEVGYLPHSVLTRS
jgi:hypothetical protein